MMAEFLIGSCVQYPQEEIAMMKDTTIKDFETILKYTFGLSYCLSVFDIKSIYLKAKLVFQ